MELFEKLEAGGFVVLAEMPPPQGTDTARFVAEAARVKNDIDAFIVPEMPSAVMRMSALGGAALLRSRDLPVVMQANCRDRNRLALQGDLLAAGALGVEAVVVVEGEDPSLGNQPDTKVIYDLDPDTLIGAVKGLIEGRDMSRTELNGSPKFMVGATANLGVAGRDMEIEMEALEKKIEAGARFFVTPPVFDPSTMALFLKRIEDKNVFVLPTVLLLKSVGMARYIDRHLKHIKIPPALIDRLVKAPDKARECVSIAADTIAALKDSGLPGVVISALGWEDKLPLIFMEKPTRRVAQAAGDEGPIGSWGKEAREAR